LPNAQVVCNARAYEVLYDEKNQRATGVAYLDVGNPDDPQRKVLPAKHVIVSCGAVQTARLLLMSGPTGGLGNSSCQVGRNAMFHLFGLGMTVSLKPKYQGLLHSEFGPTGNTATYANYLVKGDADKWYKGGIFASSAIKNPLEKAVGFATNPDSTKVVQGLKLLQKMDANARTLQLRITGDDLPRSDNRVDLDPNYVDEFGFPAARTMKIAQGLYEGVEVGGETVGLITYMRTDGVTMAGEAVAESRCCWCPATKSSGISGSIIDTKPAFILSTLLVLTSTPTTVCPSDTRQPAQTVPT